MINAKVTYLEFEGGFWGLKAENQNYQPINFPEQLKRPESEIQCTVEILEDFISFTNWGIPCKITAFITTTSKI